MSEVSKKTKLAAALVLMASLSACGTGSAKTSAHAGGTVVVALPPQAAPNWFLPVFSASAYSSYNLDVHFLMYRPMVYLNKSSQVDFSRSLITHIGVNPTQTTFTLTLGHKYKWSNGSPITAQDIVFTWDLIKAASSSHSPWPYGAAGSGGVPALWQSVQAKGPNTVVIHLAHAVNPTWFIHNGLTQIWPMPKSIWDKYPGHLNHELRFLQSVANSPSNPLYKVVDGPFHFQSWQPNNYWSLVPNKNFGGHQASISRLVFQYETSSSNEVLGLKNGSISVGYLPPSLGHVNLPNDVQSSTYLFGANYMVINFNPKAANGMGPVLSQGYVRQALQMGIDQPGIIRSLYHGSGVPTFGPIPPTPKTIYIDSHLTNPYPFNITAAVKLLESHGWHEVNGTMTRHGQRLAFPMLYASGSVTTTRMMELIKSDWAREGIQITLRQMPISELLGTINQSHPSGWAIGYWGGGWTYQLDYYPTGGNLFASGAGENMGGYQSSTLNSLIQATYQPGTSAAVTQRLDNYQQYMVQHLPVLWMPWFPMGYARVIGYNEHAKNIHGAVKYFNPVTDRLYANYWTVGG